MNKKFIQKMFFLVLVLFICSTTKVNAATASIGTSKANAYVGDKVVINVKVDAGAWNLKVNGSGISDVVAGFDMEKNVITNKLYDLDTSKPGTYVVSLIGDITDFDTDVTTYPNTSVTVTVSEKPQEEVKPTPSQTPKVVVENTNNTNNNTNNNSSNINTSTNVSTTTNNKQVTTKKEEKKEEQKEVVEEVKELPKITRFEIIGYQFDFNPESYVYNVKVLPNLTDLYIIVEGEEIEVTGMGKVNITDQDSVVVSVKYKDNTYDYKINIDRVNENEKTVTNTVLPTCRTNTPLKENMLIILASAFDTAILIFIISRIVKRKQVKKKMA